MPGLDQYSYAAAMPVFGVNPAGQTKPVDLKRLIAPS